MCEMTPLSKDFDLSLRLAFLRRGAAPELFPTPPEFYLHIVIMPYYSVHIICI
jgi:hypothetical protein